MRTTGAVIGLALAAGLAFGATPAEAKPQNAGWSVAAPSGPAEHIATLHWGPGEAPEWLPSAFTVQRPWMQLCTVTMRIDRVVIDGQTMTRYSNLMRLPGVGVLREVAYLY